MKFINDSYTGMTSLDAETAEDLTISGIFIGQTKEVGFRLGNEESSDVDFFCTASGLNSTINDDVEFSTDGSLSWETSATVSGVRPNEVTPRIACRYTPEEGEFTGIGSFLIHVDTEVV